MANWRGLGAFFDGFNQGYDTTGRVLRDIDLAKIASEKPEDITAIDQSNQGPMPDGTALSETQAAGPAVKVGTKFLGKSFDTPLNDEQVNNARLRAMADVIAKSDPQRGLQLRNQVNQSERDLIRFEQDGQRFEQERIEAGLRTKGLQRQERNAARDETTDKMFGQYLSEYNGSPEQLSESIKHINNGSRALTIGAPDKNGLVRISVVKPDGTADFMKLPKQDQATLFAASRLLEINPTRALALMAGVNKDLAAAVAAENGLTRYVADNTNDVAAKSDQMRNNAARLGIEGARLGLAREQNDRTKWVPEQYLDKDGNLRLFDVNRSNPGKPQIVERQMPEGMRPYAQRDAGLKVNQDGSVVANGKLYVPDPKVPGKFVEAKGIGPSATDLALARLGNGAGPAQAPSDASPARPAPAQIEKTVGADGRPRFRLPGQSQWYATESQARWAEIERLRGANSTPERGLPTYGFTPD